MNEEQNKYFELQLLNAQIKQATQQLENIQQQVLELQTLQKNLDELSGVRKGTDILIPVGSGIFVKGKIEDSKELLINVGTGINVPRTSDEAREMINKQVIELQTISEDIEGQVQQLYVKMQEAQNK